MTYGRDNTNSMFDVNQTCALIGNYIRQHHSARFVGAVRCTDLHGCTTGFTCRSFVFCGYSRFKLTDTGPSYYIYIYSFIHLVVRLTTGPKPLPKRALHIVRSRASSFK